MPAELRCHYSFPSVLRGSSPPGGAGCARPADAEEVTGASVSSSSEAAWSWLLCCVCLTQGHLLPESADAVPPPALPPLSSANGWRWLQVQPVSNQKEFARLCVPFLPPQPLGFHFSEVHECDSHCSWVISLHWAACCPTAGTGRSAVPWQEDGASSAQGPCIPQGTAVLSLPSLSLGKEEGGTSRERCRLQCQGCQQELQGRLPGCFYIQAETVC